MLHNERAQAGFGQIEHLPRGKGYATPRSYGVSNSAPYATAPAVGSAGDTYFNTTNKTLYISDGTAWQLQPYVPPQTPPATGNNYFTDAAGEVWVSQAGGVWKKATEVLFCRVYKNNAWVYPTAANALGWDTSDRDVYGICPVTTTRLTVPIGGLWTTQCFLSSAAFTAFPNWIAAVLYKNGAAIQSGLQQTQPASGGNWPTISFAATLYLTASDYLEVFKWASVQVSGTTGVSQSISLKYEGTG
jgi:hypothetical protein